MTDLVVDASVVIKWVLPEADTPQALALRGRQLAAPDLLTAECANVLWKHARRGELSTGEAHAAAGVLAASRIDLVPMRGLLAAAMKWAIRLGHPAYDCFYLALAEKLAVPLVTADMRMQRQVLLSGASEVVVRHLAQAV